EADQHQIVALGSEVDLVDLVDDDRKVRATTGRQPEEGRVVTPWLDGHVHTGRAGERRGPGAGGIDDDRRREPAAIRVDADDPVALDGDSGDATPVEIARPAPARPLEEASGGARRVGVPRLRLERPDPDAVENGARDQVTDLTGRDR